MAIATADDVVNAMANSSQNVVINKIANANITVAGQFHSLWRVGGAPGAADIPGALAVLTKDTPGAMRLVNASGGDTNYISRLAIVPSIVATDLFIHDRLLQVGNINTTLTTTQTVNADASHVNLTARIGDADYSDVQWWLEWQTDGNASVAAISMEVEYNDGFVSTAVVTTSATMRSSRMMPIVSGVTGKYIKKVISVRCGTAIGGGATTLAVVATRARAGMSLGTANAGSIADFVQLGLPQVAADACLFMFVLAGGTQTGAFYGRMQIISG